MVVFFKEPINQSQIFQSRNGIGFNNEVLNDSTSNEQNQQSIQQSGESAPFRQNDQIILRPIQYELEQHQQQPQQIQYQEQADNNFDNNSANGIFEDNFGPRTMNESVNN
jgi:hypothetical protein